MPRLTREHTHHFNARPGFRCILSDLPEQQRRWCGEGMKSLFRAGRSAGGEYGHRRPLGLGHSEGVGARAARGPGAHGHRAPRPKARPAAPASPRGGVAPGGHFPPRPTSPACRCCRAPPPPFLPTKVSKHARSADVTGMGGAVALAHPLRDARIEHAMRLSEDGYAHDQRCAPTIGAIRDFSTGMCPRRLDLNNSTCLGTLGHHVASGNQKSPGPVAGHTGAADFDGTECVHDGMTARFRTE